MRKKPEAANPLEQFQSIYLQTRRPALALALAATGHPQQAYSFSIQAHQWSGMRTRRQVDVVTIIQRLYRQLGRRSATAGHVPDVPQGLQALDLPAKAAWALHRVGGLEAETVRQILGLTEADLSAALSRADGALTPQDAQRFGDQVNQLLDKKEIWSDISYQLEKHTRTARLLRTGVIVALAAIALFLIGRESLSLSRMLRLQPQLLPGEITESYDSAQFYRRFPEVPSTTYPRINQRLLDRMAPLADDQPVRVAFRFYDRAVMLGLREDNRTLEDLYVDMYEDAFGRGLMNRLMAHAIEQYYKNYQRPYMPNQRQADFHSDYDSIYQAAMAVSREGDAKRLVQQHPEVFGSQQLFDQYLTSQRFLAEVPGIGRLLRGELLISQSRQQEQEEDPELRQVYEDALFAFTNPAGMNGKVNPAHFAFQREQLPAFFKARETLGKRLYQANVQRAQEMLPPEAHVNSDILEGSESSLMSATLTKGQSIGLAQDDRFFFLGIAPANAAFYDGRIESDLAARARSSLQTRFDVFSVDEEYRLYSVNYAAPLKLPQGFIDDLRGRLNSKDTQFEAELQYIYQMRYAHPESRLGWTLLRTLDQQAGQQYTSKEYKAFTRMARE